MSRPARAAGRRTAAALLAAALAAGCDYPFHPFQEDTTGTFSVYGYLDLGADTQWVRVMPVRQSLLPGPDPIDAAVTLEDEATGRVVALRDSLFRFTDPRLQADAYVHNFWTTERLTPGATYRLRAVRADGDSTTARVEMPPELRFSYVNLDGVSKAVDGVARDTAWLEVHAERVLFVEVLHAMRSPAGAPAGTVVRRQPPTTPTGDPGTQVLLVDGAALDWPDLVDVGRTELRVGAVRADWPWLPDVSDLQVALPDGVASNVAHGLGFVGGAATRTVPFQRCRALAPRPGSLESCAVTFDARSATVAGRALRPACAGPDALAEVRLTETFAEGGAVILKWRTGWNGEYRFEGVEPGAALSVEVDGAPALDLPRLAPGQRYEAPDLAAEGPC